MSARVLCCAGLLVLVLVVAGCQTYETRQVVGDGATRGYPFIFSKPYLAKLTWEDNTTSMHLVLIPTLYAVDVERAAIGTTNAVFETHSDGFASRSTVNLDQKVPENIEAIAKMLEVLGVKTGNGPGAPPPAFSPQLLTETLPRSIELIPIP